jgi:outer membrane protein OmpA-like peptidoglycan-associated protein
MKKLLLLFCSVLAIASADAQDYLGLSTGNYSGIQGVMLQPANVADNRYKWELNLVSTNIGFQNNYIGLSRNYFVNNRFSFDDYDSYDDFKRNVMTENAVSGNSVQFNLSNRLNLPSLLLTTGKKSGIAIGLQSRTAIAVDNMNSDFAKQLYDEWQHSPTYGVRYNLDGMDLSALNWFEGSLTYGRVLIDNGKHFLKAGVTGKYLGGISSWYLHADDMDAIANNDSTLRLVGSKVRYGHSETNISGQIGDYRPDANGFGFDAGLVYEFRGRINKFKFLKLNKEGDDVYTSTRRDKNKYSFKLGVSLVDVGQLTFNSTPLARDFASTPNLINLKNNGIRNVQTLDTFISKNVDYLDTNFANVTSYTVAMPTALSAQFDWHLFKGFYVNAMAYLPFNSLNKDADYRVFTPNYYAVTPRWESRAVGLYVPLVYNNNNNEDKDFTIGSTVRVGPLFVGTSNVLTLFKKDNIQSADLHVGFKLPFAHGKPSKAANWFKKFTNEKDETTIINNNTNSEKIIEKEVEIENEKIIEKEEKKEPVRPIQIIINNYNTSSGAKKNRQQIIDVDPQSGESIQREVTIDDNTTYEEYNNVNSDSPELNNMQQQIEYLKYKLKQKQNLLDEMEKEQERIKNGTSNEESKKKIDSLSNDYFYNNNFVWNGTNGDTIGSVLSSETQLFELRKELLALDAKNTKLDIIAAEITKENEIIELSAKESDKEALSALGLTMQNLRTKEYLAVKPVKTYYHESPQLGYDNNVRTNNSPNITPIEVDRFYSNRKEGSNIYRYNANVNKASSYENNAQYESLQKEIRALRSELKDYKKTEKRKVNWVPFNNGKNTRSTNVVTNNTDVKIIRDTIYLEKPVETVVTKIVRDTITNTIEKNNIITKTETKEVKVEVDNTEGRLLEMPAYFILFDVNSASVKEIYRSKLDYYAMQLKKYPALNIKLTGHADATGNAAANLALSKRRAQQVRNYLVLKGVNRNSITMDFNGDEDPLADNKTKTGKSQNRRVEVLYVK